MSSNTPHGGNLRALAENAQCDPSAILDFSASLNPFGPPAWLRQVISNTVATCAHYPDPQASAFKTAVSDLHEIPVNTIAVGAGTNQLIHAAARLATPGDAYLAAPSFCEYEFAAQNAGHQIAYLEANSENNFQPVLEFAESAKIAFLGHPNNPCGNPLDPAKLRAIAASHPDMLFVIDEAFADFCASFDSLIADRPANVLVLRSLTKSYAIPGIRIGYAVGDTELIARLERLIPAWSIGSLALAVGEQAVRDQAFILETQAKLPPLREALRQQLNGLPLCNVGNPSANFLLLKITDDSWDCHKLADALMKHAQIAMRPCANFPGLDKRFIRIAVRSQEENNRLIEALTQLLLPNHPKKRAKKPTPALMLQGTASNVGKSVLTAAFCRILLQDGYRVAPFKAQNMSLNAYVTRDGKEMGVAQAIQAQACRLDPDVRMNPILLKPLSTKGSQMILLGKSMGTLSYNRYCDTKKQSLAAVRSAYDELAADHDVMVLEGAGSPGEVNLKSRDLVNMRMAQYAHAKVLLAGDIDRGGVYASFIGTMEVLEEWERKLITGFIVNRFRGDATLLQDAHDYLDKHVSKPVLGVVPYFNDLGLPQEDSVDFKSGLLHDTTPLNDRLDVAVIDLPHAANVADLDPLHGETDLRLRMVAHARDLGTPDLIVIPGTRNVMADLAFLHETELTEAIRKVAESAKTEVVGICGGCQMLGTKIHDPHHIESNQQNAATGIGLLSLQTELHESKIVTQSIAQHQPSGLMVRGYEIHHGRSTAANLSIHLESDSGTGLGWHHPILPAWGTYLHGIFDDDQFRDWFIRQLRTRNGLPADRTSTTYDLEPALDRLADRVRESVELDAIYQALGL